MAVFSVSSSSTYVLTFLRSKPPDPTGHLLLGGDSLALKSDARSKKLIARMQLNGFLHPSTPNEAGWQGKPMMFYAVRQNDGNVLRLNKCFHHHADPPVAGFDLGLTTSPFPEKTIETLNLKYSM